MLYTRELDRFWAGIEEKKLNRHVSLDMATLKSVASNTAHRDFIVPDWNNLGFYPQDERAFISNQLVANCFNFCFNVVGSPGERFTIEDEMGRCTGSMAMQRCMYKTFGERVITAKDLRPYVSSVEGINALFAGRNPIPVPELRQLIGADFVENLETYFNGDPLNLYVEALQTDFDGTRWLKVSRLTTMLTRLFRVAYGFDIQTYQGEQIAFHKRAQLVALILHGRAVNTPQAQLLAPVQDLNQLGPVADYSVPRALHALGILRYSSDLEQRISRWTPLEEGSDMEVEIRIAQSAAVIRLQYYISLTRKYLSLPPVDISQMDYWLWHSGRGVKQYPHLCLTSAY